MKRSIGLGIMLIVVLLALSIFVALAQNQTASKDKINANKTLNNSTNIPAVNNTTNINLIGESEPKNITNPFAKARGKVPEPPGEDGDD